MLNINPLKQTPTLLGELYYKIKNDIIFGYLQPDSKLRIKTLTTSYSSSAGTVREALTRLSTEGIVEAIDNKGFKVSPISLKAFIEIHEMRLMLEIKAISSAIEFGDDEWEDKVVLAYHRLNKIQKKANLPNDDTNTQSLKKANEYFHDTLVSACNNGWILWMRKLFHYQSMRYLHLCMDKKSIDKRDLTKEHKDIMDAAIDRDIKLAAKYTEIHLHKTFEIVEAELKKISKN